MNPLAAIRTIIVMGVTGSGKSTLGSALARALGWRFLEGDTLHPPANIAKMAAGIALDDADRQPFLENVADAIAAGAPGGLVVSCSALKRRYRDQLRAGDAPVLFVLPVLSRTGLHARVSQRTGHFMPASLLDGQLDTLEPPQADESCIQVAGDIPTPEQVRQILIAAKADGLTLITAR